MEPACSWVWHAPGPTALGGKLDSGSDIYRLLLDNVHLRVRIHLGSDGVHATGQLQLRNWSMLSEMSVLQLTSDPYDEGSVPPKGSSYTSVVMVDICCHAMFTCGKWCTTWEAGRPSRLIQLPLYTHYSVQ